MLLLIVISVLLKSLAQSCLERRDVSIYGRVRTGGSGENKTSPFIGVLIPEMLIKLSILTN